MVNCAVSSCKNRSVTTNLRNHGVSYHTFPTSPVIREKWRTFCGHAYAWKPTRTSVICSSHFTASSFEVVPNNRRLLVKGAIPTKNKVLRKKEPPAKLLKSANDSTALLTDEVSTSQLQIEVKNSELISQPQNHYIPQSVQSRSKLNSQPPNKLSQSISELSTKPVSQLTENTRIKRLLKQLQLKNEKIRQLQEKNLSLKKKVSIYRNTLQELANNLDLFI